MHRSYPTGLIFELKPTWTLGVVFRAEREHPAGGLVPLALLFPIVNPDAGCVF
jgi:hypothetical protein